MNLGNNVITGSIPNALPTGLFLLYLDGNRMSGDLPFFPDYDADTKLIYLAGKGDGNVNLFSLSQYSSSEPQRGFAFAPKRAVNLQETEIYKGYKLQNNMVEVISFTVPRKVILNSYSLINSQLICTQKLLEIRRH